MWSDEENQHMGTCAEFPSLSFFAESPAYALAGITAAVKEVVQDMKTENETVPAPLSLNHIVSNKLAN